MVLQTCYNKTISRLMTNVDDLHEECWRHCMDSLPVYRLSNLLMDNYELRLLRH